MRKEKRLIDANEIKFHTIGAGGWNQPEEVAYDYEIDKIPTVDAVEVVRCKDCGGWCRNVGLKDSPNGHCFTHDIDTNGYDYCSYGERKDNG